MWFPGEYFQTKVLCIDKRYCFFNCYPCLVSHVSGCLNSFLCGSGREGSFVRAVRKQCQEKNIKTNYVISANLCSVDLRKML
uniref:Uncharacterized protein n=1 Tax=Pyxicephalus adspersus TaxID=30357 RepID=A0AAV3A213_PYXAD|nr:TPA: hypothetical protein GDO54_018150 [Pyxicephalus adspersus]